MRIGWAALLFGVSPLACGQSAEPREQWIVVVSTDARLPQMGDRIFIDVLAADGDPSACNACSRMFGVHAGDLPLEFGIVPPETGRELRVRARLSSSRARDGSTYIDRIATLPEPQSVVRLSLGLSMSCFGLPADPIAGSSCDPKTGQLAPVAPLADVATEPPLLVDAWPGPDVPCASEPDPDAVCVPGGVFLLGDPALAPGHEAAAPSAPERPVRISPFQLDRFEFTLRRYWKLVDENRAPAAQPYVGVGCTFSHLVDPDDLDLPLNCVERDLAAALCAAEGKRLPTEAEWEFAAANRTLETPYPWGSDDDVCAHALVARSLNFGVCLYQPGGTLPMGLVPVGQVDDATSLGVHDLGGNVSEWVEGRSARYDSPCFGAGAGVATDPLCDDPSYAPVARGGSWTSIPLSAHATARIVVDTASNAIGFRCARSDD